MSSSQQSQGGFTFPTTGFAQPAAAESPIATSTPSAIPQPTSTTQASTSSAPSQPQTRQAAEEARKDRTLAEFMLMLDDYEPLVCVSVYYSSSKQNKF